MYSQHLLPRNCVVSRLVSSLEFPLREGLLYWQQLLWIHLMFPVTKGYLNNKDRIIICHKESLY